jgi:GH15 family glucan-1,4-alpha-glucosidase
VSQLPISEYALLSDSHTAALVSRAGSVDWLCFPRFDAPAIFGRLLDDTAGYWTIRPTGEARVSRQYVERALVLQTRFETDRGQVTLTDALAVGPNERGHELGAHTPHALLRQVHGIRGEVELEIEYAPRPEYGIVIPLLAPVDRALLARGGAAVLLLSSPVAWEVTEGTAHARITIREGEVLGLALQYRSSSDDGPAGWGQQEIADYLEDTIRAWQSWSDIHQRYQGPWKDLVHQSGRVLQGLTYFPTGAMVAAATTSLPEQVGGERSMGYCTGRRGRNNAAGGLRYLSQRTDDCAIRYGRWHPVPAVTIEQMREVDRIAVEATGPALLQMIKNVGRSPAELACQKRGHADMTDAVQEWGLEAHRRLQGQRRGVRRPMSAHGDSA